MYLALINLVRGDSRGVYEANIMPSVTRWVICTAYHVPHTTNCVAICTACHVPRTTNCVPGNIQYMSRAAYNELPASCNVPGSKHCASRAVYHELRASRHVPALMHRSSRAAHCEQRVSGHVSEVECDGAATCRGAALPAAGIS